ncbi:cold-shock' DNA-binding domain-domain-containing protein [Syncephalastrum racemosum]|uniref:Cold-shock' DNA-binding domain-domain-containing protein n=1 Tax=Syncephalastrum racemosum TaxID=13706 RepID=A0A1X2HM37_SYNRA|nr:cold-shock' DNA-binding domain-domain-containing protein [Syncephalastrum racemosum]
MASQAATSRQTGRVKFFNSTKGYGFIIPDDQAGQPNIEEVFVHHTAIYNSGGFKSLSEGEEVEYDLVQGPKGMQAANVSGPGGVPVRGDPYATYMRNTHNGYDGRSRYGDAASGGVGSGAMSGGGKRKQTSLCFLLPQPPHNAHADEERASA